jgi:hypothetical protein
MALIIGTVSILGYFFIAEEFPPRQTPEAASSCSKPTSFATWHEPFTTAAANPLAPNPIPVPNNLTALFSLFSEMTVQMNSTLPPSNHSEVVTESFWRLGPSVVDGRQTTAVNFTSITNGSPRSGVVEYAKDGSVAGVSMSKGQASTDPDTDASVLTVPFSNYIFVNTLFSSENEKVFSELHPMGTITQSFGGVTMNVTTFSNMVLGKYVTVSFGRVPGSDYYLLTCFGFYPAFGLTGLGTYGTTWRLVSATRG